MKMGQQIYEAEQANAPSPEEPGYDAGDTSADEEVVDAEFSEVDGEADADADAGQDAKS
jgi:molecular chaperone DnaK